MRLTWLGWAGVELEAEDGTTVVVDALNDAGAVFRGFGERAAGTPCPEVVPAQAGKAVAGLVTHLHLDHADAAALTDALVPGAPVYAPPPGGGGKLEELALVQAERELAAAPFAVHRVQAWETRQAGAFTLTALPSVDGLGEPQVAWCVEADGVRVLHLGDTIYHAYWWRMALRHGPFDVVCAPVNGAVISFPHRQPPSPLPGALDPDQAALAVALLQARLAIPIHAEGYELAGAYVPVPDAAARFAAAASERGTPTHLPTLGGSIDLTAPRPDAMSAKIVPALLSREGDPA